MTSGHRPVAVASTVQVLLSFVHTAATCSLCSCVVVVCTVTGGRACTSDDTRHTEQQESERETTRCGCGAVVGYSRQRRLPERLLTCNAAGPPQLLPCVIVAVSLCQAEAEVVASIPTRPTLGTPVYGPLLLDKAAALRNRVQRSYLCAIWSCILQIHPSCIMATGIKPKTF